MAAIDLSESYPPEGSGGAGPDGQAPSTTRAKDFLNKPRKKAPAWPQGEIGHARGRPGTDVASHRAAKGRPNVSASKAPRLSLVRLSDVKTEKVAWLWYPYIPKGKVTSIEGDPGVGKSWLTTAIAAAISKGQPLPGQHQSQGPQTVLMLSAEDGLGDTIKPRLEALGASLDSIHALDEAIVLDDKGLERFRRAIKKTQPAVVFIDPLVAYMGGKIDLHKANEVRVLMRALAQVAEKFGCAIVTLRHLRKSRGGAAIYQGLGSIDITAACRSVLMVGTDSGRQVVAQAKCNLAKLGSSLAYSIDKGRFRWLGQVSATAEDLAAEPDDRDTRGALTEAMDFLREALGKGPLPSADLEEAAKEAGISERTLRRARRRLGARARLKGGRWVCSLPPEGQEPQGQKVGPLAPWPPELAQPCL